MCRILPGALARLSSLIGPSEAPKSTVCASDLLLAAAGADGLIIEMHRRIRLA